VLVGAGRTISAQMALPAAIFSKLVACRKTVALGLHVLPRGDSGSPGRNGHKGRHILVEKRPPRFLGKGAGRPKAFDDGAGAQIEVLLDQGR